MKKLPKKMELCELEVLVMPNGEVVCLGNSIGYFNDFKTKLTIKTVRTKKIGKDYDC